MCWNRADVVRGVPLLVLIIAACLAAGRAAAGGAVGVCAVRNGVQCDRARYGGGRAAAGMAGRHAGHAAR